MSLRKFFGFVISYSFVLFSCANKDLNLVYEKFTTTFPNTKVLYVDESPLKNVYEVYVETSRGRPTIVYYVPEQELIIFGEVWTVNGTSLTEKRVERFLFNDSTKDRFLKK